MLGTLLLTACGLSRAPDIPVRTIPTKEADALHIAVVGDMGKPGARHAAVANAVGEVCARHGCDLIVFTGDNVYPRGAVSRDDPVLMEVFGPYLDLGTPIMAVLGNHDWGHGFDREAAEFQVAFAQEHQNLILPGTDHVVHAGPATLAGVDTTRVFWEGTSWRNEWLRALFQRTGARWKILVGHHPYRSDGPHGDAGSYEGWRFVPWMSGSSLAKMFDDIVCGHTDLYLAGHDHSLQHLRHCGRDLVISGAGASTTGLSESGDRMWGAESLGFAWIRLEDEATIRFYDHEGRALHTVSP